MFFTGYPSIVVIRVVNKTKVVLEKIRLFHDGSDANDVYIKKIKPDDVKQTGLSTRGLRTTELKMSVFDKDKEYLIKKELTNNYKGTICININNINDDGDLEFDVTFE